MDGKFGIICQTLCVNFCQKKRKHIFRTLTNLSKYFLMDCFLYVKNNVILRMALF